MLQTLSERPLLRGFEVKCCCSTDSLDANAAASNGIYGNEREGTCVHARAGAIIKEIREESGAHIKILPAEDLPSCGLSNDRVVQ